MSVPLCTFIREATGATCGSPAMNGTDRCYHHRLDGERQQYLKDLRKDPSMKHVLEAMDLPPLETADDIQICLSNLFHAVAARRLGLHDVDRLLAVLRLASRNVRLKMQADVQVQKEQEEDAEDDVPTITADCLYDEQLRDILALIDAPEKEKDHLLYQLTMEDCGWRHEFRKQIFGLIHQQLAAMRPSVAEQSRAQTEVSTGEAAGPSNSMEVSHA